MTAKRSTPTSGGQGAIDLPELVGFMSEMQTLRGIIRKASVPRRDEYENDAEHSYMVAVMILYLMLTYPKLFEGMDRFELLANALIHDWPEGPTRDIPWDVDDSQKHEINRAGFVVLRAHLPRAKRLMSLLKKFMKLKSRESKKVARYDKVASTLVIFLSQGRSWREHGQTMDWMIGRLVEKFHETGPCTPAEEELLEDLIALVRAHPQYFAPPP
jgi:putative hydrolase of HD superfamily